MSDPWSSSTPRTNADFRALLSTPRPHHGNPSGGSEQHRERHRPAGEKKEHKFKKPAPRPKPKKPGQEEEEEPAYRDRAKERREGRLDQEYLERLEKAGLNAEALTGLTEEQSKFFGGDESFSHLVKGLDYALLERERQKAAQQQTEEKQTRKEAPAAAAAHTLFQAPLHFETPLGRAVYEATCKPPPNRRALIREMFLPRRTAFLYDFDPETGGSDVPTTLRRSKADCPPVQERVFAGADGSVLEAIAKIMSYLASSMGTKGGKKARRKDHSDFIRSILMGTSGGSGDTQVHGQLVVKNNAAIAAGKAAAAAAAATEAPAGPAAGATGPSKPTDDDDDIFGDAGTDYVPELPKKDKAEGAAAAARRGEGGSYFESRQGLDVLPANAPAVTGEEDMDIEEGELAGPSGQGAAAAAAGSSGWQQGGYQQQQQQHGYGQYDAYYDHQQQQYAGYQQGYQQQQKPEEEVPKWRASTKAPKGFAPDAYDECFPETAFGGNPIDSDDEGEEGKKAKGAPGTEEAAGGGKPGKNTEERKRTQKLDGQLQQIKKVFTEKGYGNEAAFKKERQLEVGMTPARNKRIKL